MQLSFDITARKHGGNVLSQLAHEKVKPHKDFDQARVFRLIKMNGTHGITAKEAAVVMERQLNAISGRFTELHLQGRTYRNGLRRDGAAVWVVR